jgi:hypothetical protein
MLKSIDDHSEGPLAMFLMAWRKHKNRILDLDVFVIPVVPYNVQILSLRRVFSPNLIFDALSAPTVILFICKIAQKN